MSSFKNSRQKLWLFFTFLASYLALVLLFAQSPANIVWETLVASGVYAGLITFFVFLCFFSRWFLAGWITLTLSLTAFSHFTGNEPFHYRAPLLPFGSRYMNNIGTDYDSPCPVSFYCFESESPHYLLIKTAFEVLFMLDISALIPCVILLLVILIKRYPPTLYFTIGGVFGFLALALTSIQYIPNVNPYDLFQYGILSLLYALALFSFSCGIFYKNKRLKKLINLYVSLGLAMGVLFPLLIPFKEMSGKEMLTMRIILLPLAIGVFALVYSARKRKHRKPSHNE